MKKYKIRKDLSMEYNGRTLYRIEALRDIENSWPVKKGDLGGWIEKESNLSQEGDCWIYDDGQVYSKAKVYGNARIYDNGKVDGNACLYGDAYITDNAEVFGEAEVYGNACISDNAIVCGNAKVYGWAWVADDLDIYKNARVCDSRIFGKASIFYDIINDNKKTYYIKTDDYDITIISDYITIDCQTHTKKEWWKFTDREIIEMDGKKALEFWKKWKPILQAICEEK